LMDKIKRERRDRNAPKGSPELRKSPALSPLQSLVEEQFSVLSPCLYEYTANPSANRRQPIAQGTWSHSYKYRHDAEHFHEEIHNKKTGETKTITHDTPHESTHTTTYTTNPYTVETNGAEQKTKQGDSITLDTEPSHCPATVGYDTSQL
ncbi:unnamed protein product, partial [Aureobasidium pullulans]